MIEGVVIKNLTVHPDVPDLEHEASRGFLMEIIRDDDRLLKKFGQSTYTVTEPNTIKAFHWHKKQDDLWFIASGRARVVLYDRRTNSKSFGQTMSFTAGQDDYKLIVIPAGVAHGFQVLSDSPVQLFYHTTESYNPENPDEFRIKYDDPEINFDWDSPVNNHE